MAPDLLSDGYAIVPHTLSDSEVNALQTWSHEFEGHRLNKLGSTFAVRYILGNPIIRDLVRKPALRDIASKFVGPKCIAVGGTLFDKIADASWLVPYHQDLTAAAKERREVSGFGPWSVKGGLKNVQLPSEILNNMVALRLHLDDCSEDDGALRVLPKSHAGGRLDSAGILKATSSISARVCAVRKGDALIMRPLLLHASSASKSGRPRRVVHIEYAGTDLPDGLEWRFAVGD